METVIVDDKAVKNFDKGLQELDIPCRYDIAVNIIDQINNYLNKAMPDIDDSQAFIDSVQSKIDELSAIEQRINGEGIKKPTSKKMFKEAVSIARATQKEVIKEKKRITRFVRKIEPSMAEITKIANGYKKIRKKQWLIESYLNTIGESINKIIEIS